MTVPSPGGGGPAAAGAAPRFALGPGGRGLCRAGAAARPAGRCAQARMRRHCPCGRPGGRTLRSTGARGGGCAAHRGCLGSRRSGTSRDIGVPEVPVPDTPRPRDPGAARTCLASTAFSAGPACPSTARWSFGLGCPRDSGGTGAGGAPLRAAGVFGDTPLASAPAASLGPTAGTHQPAAAWRAWLRTA